MNSLRWYHIIITAMIEHDRNPQGAVQVRFKFGQVQCRCEKDQSFHVLFIFAGVNRRHQTAITGPDQNQICLVAKNVIEFIHSPLQRAGKILQDHPRIFFPEKFTFRAITGTFETMDENSRCLHGLVLFIESGWLCSAFPLRSICQYVRKFSMNFG